MTNDLKAAVERELRDVIAEATNAADQNNYTRADWALMINHSAQQIIEVVAAHLSPPEPIPEGELISVRVARVDEQGIWVHATGRGALALIARSGVVKPLPSEPAPVDGEYSSLGLKSPTHPVSTWLPISTAPKDGTVIDVWRDEGGRDTVFWGYPHHDCGEMGGLCDSDWHSIRAPGWVCNSFGEFLGRKHAPFTHWRPLPAPPTPAGTLPAGTERSDCEITPNTAPVDEGERERNDHICPSCGVAFGLHLSTCTTEPTERAARIICRVVHKAMYPDEKVWREGELDRCVDQYWQHWTDQADDILAPLLAKLKAGEEELKTAQLDAWCQKARADNAEARADALAAEVGRLRFAAQKARMLTNTMLTSPFWKDAIEGVDKAIKDADETLRAALTDGGGE